MYKEHYKHFFESNPERLHFAAHSHHPWPDVTKAAQLAYWTDSATKVDTKWGEIFDTIVPTAQKNVAQILGLSRPQDICFAPNTHELVARLLSCFDLEQPIKILTTDSEFHSFSRQIKRYEELEKVSVTRIGVQEFDSFSERFITEAKTDQYDLIFLSHVFFSSGFYVSDLEQLVQELGQLDSLIAVDGYHAFCALPVNLQAIEKRIFYMAGGYKYAQSGEGVCFMSLPEDCELRPINTGWFASFDELQEAQSSKTLYRDDAFRFWGATYDSSAMYRFNAMCQWLEEIGLSAIKKNEYVKALQEYFLRKLESSNFMLKHENLVCSDIKQCGHFLAFEHADATKIKEDLVKLNIVTDVRHNYLRIGFGMYQESSDIDQFFKRLN